MTSLSLALKCMPQSDVRRYRGEYYRFLNWERKHGRFVPKTTIKHDRPTSFRKIDRLFLHPES